MPQLCPICIILFANKTHDDVSGVLTETQTLSQLEVRCTHVGVWTVPPTRAASTAGVDGAEKRRCTRHQDAQGQKSEEHGQRDRDDERLGTEPPDVVSELPS